MRMLSSLLKLLCAACVAFSFATPASAKSQALLRAGDVGAVGAPLTAGLISLFKYDHQGVMQLGFSYAAALGATLALKKTINSERPNGEDESFPSGHAASAFSGASYLHYRYGLRYGIPAYAIALGVGYSRVENDKHYWRDIAAGAAIANLSAYLITTRYQLPVPIAVTTDPANGAYGVRSAFQF